MPRLIPAERGNGKRPSSPLFLPADAPGGLPSELAIVVLDVSDGTHEHVGAVHDAALDPDDPAGLLTGHTVMLDNQRHVNTGRPGPIVIHVGGSTLHEAATEVISSYEQHGALMPEWVAGTSPELVAVVAEHFTVKGYSKCEIIDLSEVKP